MSNQWGVGNAFDVDAFDRAKVGKETVDLIFGEHPHSRRDNNIYARWPSGRIDGFDGHRICTRVELEEYNYLKQSELSGDEIRKGGTGRIFFNGVQVYEFFFRRIEQALSKAEQLVSQLKEHESRLWEPEKLKGRKIFYREVPSVVESVILDQGCVMIRTADGLPFPKPTWVDEDYSESLVKEDVLSPHIWWYRK